MLKTIFLAATLCFAAAMVCVLVGAGGCSARRTGAPEAASGAVPGAAWSGGGMIAAPPGAAVAPSMRPYFAAGLGLLVLGGLAAVVGAKAAGFASMLLGGALTAIGVVIVQYPWAVLAAFLLASGVAGLAFFDRWRKQRELAKSRDALAATALVIQNLPEGKAIKQGLADLGGDVAAQVREVVTPIKDQLRLEGKI